jgi:hypothetical protein
MSSKYADKHAHHPPCAVVTCEEDGVVILSVRGRLGWFCELHKEQTSVNGERSQ